MNRAKYIIVTMLFALILTGCITANAGKDQVVHSGDKVVLDGSLSSSTDNKQLKYLWKQTKGHKVELENANSQKASFIAPNVTKNSSLKFLLTVSTIDGKNSKKASVSVLVKPNKIDKDTTPPVITLNGDANITLKVGDTYKELGATAIDDRDGNVSVEISGSVDTSKAGTYTITYTAKDKANNISKKSRVVNVTLSDDTTPPVITLNGDANITLKVGDTYTEAGVTAVDDTDGNVSVEISGSVDTEHEDRYTLTYTATDHAGNKASIQRIVKVVAATSPYGIITKLEHGNTAYYGSLQRYAIRLKTKPDANVSLSIYSSDIDEGTVLGLNQTNHNTLIFTPEDWNKRHYLNIMGTNKNVVNGVQNYTIVLEPLVSDDPNYNGIDPEDIEMRGVQLKISAPNKIQKCIANLSKTIKIETEYNGMNDLHYSLEDAPDGMTIDVKNGEIKWIPASSNGGNSYTVQVKVTDGDLVKFTKFDILVVSTNILKSKFDNNILEVVELNSSLKGLKIKDLLGNTTLSNEVIQTLDSKNIPSIQTIPKGVTKLTDVFLISPDIHGEFEIELPRSLLPNNRSLFDVRLYRYYNRSSHIKIRAIRDYKYSPYWDSSRIDFDNNSVNPKIRFKMYFISGLYFLAIKKRIHTSPKLILNKSIAKASCDFGVDFSAVNATKSSLESAMYAYQYATVQENNISLLDSNEDETKFHFDPADQVDTSQWVDGKIDIANAIKIKKVAPFLRQIPLESLMMSYML